MNRTVNTATAPARRRGAVRGGAVGDGHVPTPEIDHLGAKGAVGIVEQRLLGHDRSGSRGNRNSHYPRSVARRRAAAQRFVEAEARPAAPFPFPAGPWLRSPPPPVTGAPAHAAARRTSPSHP